MLIHKVADAQANGQVEGEEGMGHRLTPELLGDGFLVEDLSKRPMHDEHGESNGAQGCHGLAAEEPGDG